VLGFGVVWWSMATILTPIAARVGLPCLLIMRAFMGIGEVGLSYIYSTTMVSSTWLRKHVRMVTYPAIYSMHNQLSALKKDK